MPNDKYNISAIDIYTCDCSMVVAVQWEEMFPPTSERNHGNCDSLVFIVSLRFIAYRRRGIGSAMYDFVAKVKRNGRLAVGSAVLFPSGCNNALPCGKSRLIKLSVLPASVACLPKLLSSPRCDPVIFEHHNNSYPVVRIEG